MTIETYTLLLYTFCAIDLILMAILTAKTLKLRQTDGQVMHADWLSFRRFTWITVVNSLVLIGVSVIFLMKY